MKSLNSITFFLFVFTIASSFGFADDTSEGSKYLKPRDPGLASPYYYYPVEKNTVTRKNQYDHNQAYIQGGYSTSHPEAIHHIISFNPGSLQIYPFQNLSIPEILHNGTTLTLEDGSIWSFWPAHVAMVSTWFPSDQIAITRRYDFNGCYYSLENLTLGSSIPANLSLYLRPDFQTSVNRRILTCDPLILDDFSEWAIEHWDIKDWQPGDPIMIGYNGDMFPRLVNILINCRVNQSKKAICTKLKGE